jgi:hypothetical protein
MKVLRSTLVIGLAAFAAACGDKVTVAGPPTTDTTPKVNSVTVTPSAVTMAVGQTAAFSAAVDVSNGAATTVTWSSSDASKVSVTAAGVATAVAATPGVAICATSTADANKKGCASVVVTAVTNIPASVSIASITVNGTNNVTVNPAAVAGAIDVRLNINPGSQTLSRVDLKLGTTVVATQSFTAAQSAALRYAADQAIETQSTFPQVVFTVNTAACGTTPAACSATNATASFPNATYPLSAQLYAGGSATVATATTQTNLTLANADTYIAAVSTTGTTANALNAAGFRYDRGALSVSVTPVIYTGNTVAAGSVTFGSAACDASGIGARTLALTAPASGSTAWTATFSQTAAAAASNVTNYEFSTTNPLCTVNAIGETIAVTATNGAGDALFTAAAPANVNAITSLRLDNRAPAAPTLVQNPNLRQNGWVNAAIALNSANTGATSNGVVVTANQAAGAATCVAALVPDCGVSGIVRYVRIAASAAGLVDEARSATASSAAALPAPSASNTTYCGIWTMQDALGNESALPAAGTACTAPAVASNTALAATHMLFGVDIAPPTIAFSGGLAANARLNGGTVGAEFQVTVSDTGIVGNSGMLSTSAVRGTVQIRQPVGATVCLVGTGATCTPASVNAAPAFPLVPTTVVAASTTVGYYFYNAFSQDAAGNQSAAVTRVIAYDPAANVPALTGALYNIPLSGGSVTFNANANDNFDLRDIRYTLAYAGGLAGPLAYPPTTITAFPSASAGPAGVTGFNNSNVPVPVTIANFIRQVEDVTANGPITVSGAYKPNALNGFLRDVANNVPAGSPIVTPIPGASVTTGVSYLTLPAPLLPRSWAITNAATNVSTGATSPAANPLSVTLNADLFGPTATFNSPFARVDFYALIGGNLEQIGTTTAYTTVDDGSAFGRRHRYSLTWTPGTTSPVTGTAWVLGAQAIYAIGVNSAGDALVTLVNNNITLTNP